MLTRKLTHLEAHAIAHRLHQAEEIVAGVVAELAGMEDSAHGVNDGASCGWCYDEAVRGEQWTAEVKCKACNGNDGDAPCAYPEGHPDCLRNASASTLGEKAEAMRDAAMRTVQAMGYEYTGGDRWKPKLGDQPQAAEPKGLYFKRSPFRNGWTTFNIRNEDADEVERRLSKGA